MSNQNEQIVSENITGEKISSREGLVERVRAEKEAAEQLEISKVTDPELRKQVIANYNFGASGYKLGERVEVMTTGQRGVLIGEVVHLTGCNTYQVLLPKVIVDGKQKVINIDHIILRKLEDWESMVGNFDGEPLTDENFFSPKGTNVNGQWILDHLAMEGMEFIPEIDEALGVEGITIAPGTEVYHKACGIPMVVSYIFREIFSKELEYGLTYSMKDKTQSVNCRAYMLVPMRQQIDAYERFSGKPGSLFDDSRSGPDSGPSIEDFSRDFN